MQITPQRIPFKNFHTTPHNKERVTLETPQYTIPSITNVYYKPINFKSKFSTEFVKEMQSLKGIHCPICGSKMLSSDELKNILEDIKQIKTAEELQYFPKTYKDSINPVFKDTLKILNNLVYATPDASSEDVLTKLNEKLHSRMNSQFEVLQQEMSNIINNPNTVKVIKPNLVLAQKKIKYLPKNVSRMNYYKNTRRILLEAYQYSKVPEIIQEIKKLLQIIEQPIFDYNLLFTDTGEYTTQFCQKLLGHSKSDLRKVAFSEEATPQNLILSCKLCEETSKRLPFHLNDNKDSYYNYVYEMSREALAGHLSSNKAYPIELVEYVKKKFNPHITPDDSQPDLKALFEELNISPQKSNKLLPLVNESGINCAYCGQKTINHKEKQEIFAKIANAQNPKELTNIMNSITDIIRPKFLKLLEQFDNLVNKQNCPEPNIIPELKRFMCRNILKESYYAQQKLNQYIIKRNILGEYKQAILKINEELAKIKTLEDSKNFSLSEFRKAITNHCKVFPMNSKLRNEIWGICYAPFSDHVFLQQIITPQKVETIAQKVGSTLKFVLQNIVKHSVATIDHMDPRKNYSSPRSNPDHYKRYLGDKKSNLVLSCSDCNQKKSNMNFKLWVSKNPNIINNFRNYLKQIRELQKIKDLKYNVYETAVHFEQLAKRNILPLV